MKNEKKEKKKKKRTAQHTINTVVHDHCVRHHHPTRAGHFAPLVMVRGKGVFYRGSCHRRYSKKDAIQVTQAKQRAQRLLPPPPSKKGVTEPRKKQTLDSPRSWTISLRSLSAISTFKSSPGVRPSLVTLFTSAPACTSARIAPTRPHRQAKWRGVLRRDCVKHIK